MAESCDHSWSCERPWSFDRPGPCVKCGTPRPDPVVATLRDIAANFIADPALAAEQIALADRLEAFLRHAAENVAKWDEARQFAAGDPQVTWDLVMWSGGSWHSEDGEPARISLGSCVAYEGDWIVRYDDGSFEAVGAGEYARRLAAITEVSHV